MDKIMALTGNYRAKVEALGLYDGVMLDKGRTKEVIKMKLFI